MIRKPRQAPFLPEESWISAFEYEDLGLVGTMSESQFRANAASVFAKVKANGCNTVYFHVRSFDDGHLSIQSGRME